MGCHLWSGLFIDPYSQIVARWILQIVFFFNYSTTPYKTLKTLLPVVSLPTYLFAMTVWEKNATFTSPTIESPVAIKDISNFPAVAYLRGVFGLIIIAINVVEIYCIKRWTGLKNVTRTMFLNLGASDIIFGVSSLITPLLTFPQADGICSLIVSLNNISRVACSTGIMIHAFDILKTAFYHDSYDAPQFFTMSFIRKVLSISWFLTLVLGIWINVESSGIGCSPYVLF